MKLRERHQKHDRPDQGFHDSRWENTIVRKTWRESITKRKKAGSKITCRAQRGEGLSHHQPSQVK